MARNNAAHYYAQGMGTLGAGIGAGIGAYLQNKRMAGHAIAKFEGMMAADKDMVSLLSDPEAPNAPQDAIKAFAKLQKDGSLGVRDAALLAQFAETYSKEKEEEQRRALLKQQHDLFQAQVAEARAAAAREAQNAAAMRMAMQPPMANAIQGGATFEQLPRGPGALQAPRPQEAMTRFAQLGGMPTSGTNQFFGTQMANESREEVARIQAEARGAVDTARREAAEAKSGVTASNKAFEDTSSLRKEFLALDPVKTFQIVDNFLTRGERVASQDTAAGDIALIFSYMKVLDPTSVVREGEYATAENAGSVPQRVQNIYNKIVDGERLQPKQRTDYLAAMRDAAVTQYEKLTPLVRQYDAISKKRQLDQDEIVTPYYRDWKPAQANATPAPSAPSTPSIDALLQKYQ